MIHSIASRRPRRARRQVTAAAVVLLASVGWAQQVSVGEPDSGGCVVLGRSGAGFVQALATDLATSTTLYPGIDCPAVFESLDGGDSGQPTGPRSVYALAIDPATPTTLYAGTHGSGKGAFKSTNGGSNWRAVNTGLTNTEVSALAINPTSPTTLYPGTNGGGVFQSTNGSSSWQATGVVNRGVSCRRSACGGHQTGRRRGERIARTNGLFDVRPILRRSHPFDRPLGNPRQTLDTRLTARTAATT